MKNMKNKEKGKSVNEEKMDPKQKKNDKKQEGDSRKLTRE